MILDRFMLDELTVDEKNIKQIDDSRIAITRIDLDELAEELDELLANQKMNLYLCMGGAIFEQNLRINQC